MSCPDTLQRPVPTHFASSTVRISAVRRKSLSGFSARPTTMVHTVVPESKACERTMKQVNLGEHEVCLSISGENKGLCHVIPGSKLRVDHIATQTQKRRRFFQETSSTEHVEHILSSHSLMI